MVDKFGLHGAMLVIGAISLNSVACGLAVPPSPYEKHLRLARKQRRHQGTSTTLAASLKSHRDVITDFRFLVFLLTGLGFSSGLACYYLYLPDFLLHSNYDAMTASFVLSATGEEWFLVSELGLRGTDVTYWAKNEYFSDQFLIVC